MSANSVRTIPKDFLSATKSNLIEVYFSKAFDQLDEIAANVTRKDTQKSDEYISRFVRQIFEANISGKEQNPLTSIFLRDEGGHCLSRTHPDWEPMLSSTEMRDQIVSGRTGSNSPLRQDWSSSAVTIKDGQGMEQSEKVM